MLASVISGHKNTLKMDHGRFLPCPFAGSKSFHTSGYRCINQSDLVAATGITHRVEESEHGMSSFKELHEVLMVVVGDLNGLDSRDLVFGRILQNG